MRIKSKSKFKNPKVDKVEFEKWVTKLETSNGRKYNRKEINSSLGKTIVWCLNEGDDSLDTLIIFPGARTTSLVWDLDKGLDNLNHKMSIYMVETNGLPNLSDGNTPDIKSKDYGIWASEILDELKIEKAFIAGASFGGLIGMKLAIVKPEKIKALFLLNPGCLQSFSLTVKSLYYNLLPIISPKEKNVLKFLNTIVFCRPNHTLSEQANKLLIEYQLLALTRHVDKAQKPYYMDKQLSESNVDTYLLEGDQDIIFPYQKTITNAQTHIQSLKEVKIFKDVGHGIETYSAALMYVGKIIKETANTVYSK